MAKRKATKKQLAALAKGRAKLAARRRNPPVRRRIARLANDMLDAAQEVRNPCNPCRSNPNFHYPKTARGRPRKPRAFTLELYGGPNAETLLGSRKMRVSRQDAHAAASGFVGKKARGKTIHKVILTGPK